MNKYKVNLPNPVIATNDAVLSTGITQILQRKV